MKDDDAGLGQPLSRLQEHVGDELKIVLFVMPPRLRVIREPGRVQIDQLGAGEWKHFQCVQRIGLV
jgi:hypothetical protein